MPLNDVLRRRLVWVFAAICAAPLGAQAPGVGPALYSSDHRAPTRVTALGAVQSVEGDGGFGDSTQIVQASLPISLSLPIASGVGLRVRTGFASSSGDGVETLSGLADTQLALSVSRLLGTGRALFSLGANVPSGRAPSPDQTTTAFLIGQGFYGFRTPSTGRGLSIAPGVSWALPVSPDLAVGAALSYQLRGDFEPRSGAADRYDPGDEFLLTTGVNYRLAEASTLGLDVTFIHYGTDVWGDVRYETGDVVSASAQWWGDVAGYAVRLSGLARKRSDTGVDTEAAVQAGLSAAVPFESRAFGAVRVPLGRRATVDVTAQGRYYAESRTFSKKALVDLGVDPSLVLGDDLTLIGHLGITTGDLQGLDAAIGLSWSL